MTNAGLTIRRVQESDSGIYEVAVKFTNGNATENTAKLTVVSVILSKSAIPQISRNKQGRTNHVANVSTETDLPQSMNFRGLL